MGVQGAAWQYLQCGAQSMHLCAWLALALPTRHTRCTAWQPVMLLHDHAATMEQSLPLSAACPSSLPAKQRPTYLESQIRQMVGGGSVKDHLLTQVRRSSWKAKQRSVQCRVAAHERWECCSPLQYRCSAPAQLPAAPVSTPFFPAVPKGDQFRGGRPVRAQAVQARQGRGAEPGTVQG